MWKSVRCVTAAVVVACSLGVTPSHASAQVSYSSFADFLAAVDVYGVDAYDDLDADVLPGPLTRSAGSFGYSVATSSPDDIFFFPIENSLANGDWWLSEEWAGSGITFSGFAGNVRAIGGHFFQTDFSGAFRGGLLISAMDVQGNLFEGMFSPADVDSFFGLRFDYTVAWLKLAVSDPVSDEESFFATANNLVLATSLHDVPVTVPEPATTPLLLLATGAGLLFVRHRRR